MIILGCMKCVHTNFLISQEYISQIQLQLFVMPELFYEFISLITKSTTSQAQISKLILSLRYSNKDELSNLLTFATILLSCNNLNTSKDISLLTIENIFKRLILQADFTFTLLIYAKLLPLLQWVKQRYPRQITQTLSRNSKDMQLYLAPVKSSKKKQSQQSISRIEEIFFLIKRLEEKNFFRFFFQIINGVNESLQNDIHFYFLELQGSEIQSQGFLTCSQLTNLQNSIYLQYGKLRKERYREEIITTIYKWIEEQVSILMKQQENNFKNCTVETFLQIIRSHSNICGTTLLQALDPLENIPTLQLQNFLDIVDCCLIEGCYKIATQASLFLIPSIFLKLHSKKISAKYQIVYQHFQLWRQVAIKRKMPSRLLICLSEWISLLYDNPKPIKSSQPEILQLYRKEILRITGQEHNSQISGLRVVLQQLQIRKIDAVYGQLKEFHSIIDQSFKQKHSGLKENSSKGSIDFSFKISQMSKSNAEINSLLNSLQSQLSHLPHKSHHLQLQLLSKQQSLSSGGTFSRKISKSIGDCVQVIMSLIQLFDFHVQQVTGSISAQFSSDSKKSPNNEDLILSGISEYNGNMLPVLSTFQALPFIETNAKIVNNIVVVRDAKINYTILDEQMKKKITKCRGLLIKNQILEMGYSISKRDSKIQLFLTIYKPVNSCKIELQGKSFKLLPTKIISINHPKINYQYKIPYQIKQIKSYSLPGIMNSEKIKRAKLFLTVQYTKQQQQIEIQLPLYLYNIIECLPIEKEQYPTEIPSFQTKWYPICPKFVKHGQSYLKKLFIFSKDEKGNYLMKVHILNKTFLLKLIIVLKQAKIQTFNNDSPLIPMAILQMIG